MKNLKEILCKEKHVWFHVRTQDSKEFLQFAKENGCKWMCGDEVEIDKDNCDHFMGINKNLQLGFVSAMCWFYAKDKVKKIEFESIRSEK